jgi:hypothetical protein
LLCTYASLAMSAEQPHKLLVLMSDFGTSERFVSPISTAASQTISVYILALTGIIEIRAEIRAKHLQGEKNVILH